MSTRHIARLMLYFISFGIIFNTAVPTTSAQSTGNLNVLVENWNGSARSGAKVLRYTSNWQYIDQRTTGSNGWASWSKILAATYNLEAYYNGNAPPFTGDEYWVNLSTQVPAGGSSNVTARRNEPYTEDIVFKNHSTGEVLNPSEPIAPHTAIAESGILWTGHQRLRSPNRRRGQRPPGSDLPRRLRDRPRLIKRGRRAFLPS